ncbi:MAG: hypothetical protein GEU94_05395, partial [Micromonosporaceae bacterium]|nr:hypothetical protein [Micromonosporaceae bacterium]
MTSRDRRHPTVRRAGAAVRRVSPRSYFQNAFRLRPASGGRPAPAPSAPAPSAPAPSAPVASRVSSRNLASTLTARRHSARSASPRGGAGPSHSASRRARSTSGEALRALWRRAVKVLAR